MGWIQNAPLTDLCVSTVSPQVVAVLREVVEQAGRGEGRVEL